jgi:membrane protease subunit (stomatin/prohibitin family)
MIKNLQKSAVMRDLTMAAAILAGAQADAVRMAAQNAGGAITGFRGFGMAQNTGGMNAENLFAIGQQPGMRQPEPSAQAVADTGWTCTCGTVNAGKFCAECDAKKPYGDP